MVVEIHVLDLVHDVTFFVGQERVKVAAALDEGLFFVNPGYAQRGDVLNVGLNQVDIADEKQGLQHLLVEGLQ